MHARAGFTLLEIIAVVALVALLATLAGVSMRRAIARATVDDAVLRLTELDASARRVASRTGTPLLLTVTETEIAFTSLDRDTRQLNPVVLPETLKVTRMQMAGETEKLVIGPGGVSRSYMLSVEDAAGSMRRLLLAGLTGEATVMTDPAEADAVWAVLRAPEKERRP